MKPSAGKQTLVLVGLLSVVALVAVLGSLATVPNVDGWYADARKVPWNPPDAVFGPVWTALYVVLAIVGALIWRAGYQGSAEPNTARRALGVYWLQLALNAIWTPIFFAGYPLVGPAAWWAAFAVMLALIATVAWLIAAAFRWSKVAAWLLVPYLLWLLYAASLNAGIVVLGS